MDHFPFPLFPYPGFHSKETQMGLGGFLKELFSDRKVSVSENSANMQQFFNSFRKMLVSCKDPYKGYLKKICASGCRWLLHKPVILLLNDQYWICSSTADFCTKRKKSREDVADAFLLSCVYCSTSTYWFQHAADLALTFLAEFFAPTDQNLWQHCCLENGNCTAKIIA